MYKLVPAALLSIVALSFLAVNPTPLAKAMDTFSDQRPDSMTPEGYSQALERHESGETRWTLQVGMHHFWGGFLPEGVERDSLWGRDLIRQAMEAGNPHAGTMWYHFVDRTHEGLKAAAAAGDLHSIELMAMLEARRFCEVGEMPPGHMEAFLEDYRDVMTPEHYRRHMGQHGVFGGAMTVEERHREARSNILNGIPDRFRSVCDHTTSFERLLPKD
ncbi:MAG: hypothetical protein JJ896_06320 [Rhodothermales bacterium]|nr:hypothetical protein [Rhodothermales bacterium]MBO6779249.1 hypothetical protein [Rhodothermales bacterium]